MNRQVQESSREFPGDFYDESPEDSFFLPGGIREVGCKAELSTLLNTDDGVALLVHLARECTAHYAWIDSVLHYRNMYPRSVQLPMTKRRRQVYFLEASNLDAMLGRVDAVRERIRQVLADGQTRIVVLASTCLAEMTGMYLRGVLEEECAAADMPAVFLELTVDENTPTVELWSGLLQLAEDLPAAGNRVNLLGFAEANSLLVREAEQIFAAMDIEINGWFIPSFNCRAAADFTRTAATVISTAEEIQIEAAGLRADKPHLRFIDVPPPLGPRASRDFYSNVARACLVSNSSKIINETWSSHRRQWQQLQRRAQAHTVGFIVKPGEEIFLTNPDKMYGIDMVLALREMGFAVRIFCRGPESWSRSIERHFLIESQGDTGIRIITVEPAMSIARLLSESECQLVFSEFLPDHRILESGRMSFGSHDFELGFAGALHTAAHLTRLAESNFHIHTRPPLVASDKQP